MSSIETDPEPRRIRGEIYHVITPPAEAAEGPALQSEARSTTSTKFISQATLRKVAPHQHLGYLSTCSLAINRIIGTVVFLSPNYVLSLIGSKTVCLFLWLVGGLLAWAGMVVYLEYGIRWPLTGGELHYIDRVWAKPQKFFTYLYSFAFIALTSTYYNALIFGTAVLQAANPGQDPEPRLQKFFAILVVASVCIFQSYSRLAYIRFVNLFAIYKVALLLTITVMGWVAMGNVRSPFAIKGPYGITNLATDFSKGVYSTYRISQSLLSIMKAYSGLESASSILEEVQRPTQDRTRIYRRILKISIAAVTFFYVMAHVAFFAVCSTEEILAESDMLALFLSKIFGNMRSSQIASGVIMCCSATGNLMASAYTDARVTQEISRLGVVPLPEIWANATRYHSPGNALLLHFLMSTIMITAVPMTDGKMLLILGSLAVSTKTVITTFLSIAMTIAPWLKSFRQDGQKWQPKGSRMKDAWPWLVFPLAFLLLVANLYLFVVSWFPPGERDTVGLHHSSIASTMCMGVYGLGVLYWLWDTVILKALGCTMDLVDGEVTSQDSGLKVTVTYVRHFSGPAKKVLDLLRPIYMSIQKILAWLFKRLPDEEVDSRCDGETQAVELEPVHKVRRT